MGHHMSTTLLPLDCGSRASMRDDASCPDCVDGSRASGRAVFLRPSDPALHVADSLIRGRWALRLQLTRLARDPYNPPCEPALLRTARPQFSLLRAGPPLALGRRRPAHARGRPQPSARRLRDARPPASSGGQRHQGHVRGFGSSDAGAGRGAGPLHRRPTVPEGRDQPSARARDPLARHPGPERLARHARDGPHSAPLAVAPVQRHPPVFLPSRGPWSPSATPANSASPDRVELPEEHLSATFDDHSTLELTPELVGPTRIRNQGIIGKEVDLTLEADPRVHAYVKKRPPTATARCRASTSPTLSCR